MCGHPIGGFIVSKFGEANLIHNNTRNAWINGVAPAHVETSLELIRRAIMRTYSIRVGDKGFAWAHRETLVDCYIGKATMGEAICKMMAMHPMFAPRKVGVSGYAVNPSTRQHFEVAALCSEIMLDYPEKWVIEHMVFRHHGMPLGQWRRERAQDLAETNHIARAGSSYVPQ